MASYMYCSESSELFDKASEKVSLLSYLILMDQDGRKIGVELVDHRLISNNVLDSLPI